MQLVRRSELLPMDGLGLCGRLGGGNALPPRRGLPA